MTVEPGTRIGAYDVQDVLGRGAMGVVYRARHEALKRTVAIKLLQTLSPEADVVERFQLEARAIAAMRHPNILSVYDYGEVEGTPYMVVEYAEGGSLAARLRIPPGLDRGAALALLRDIGAALDHAHSRGIVHRDVKPENVLLTADGTPVVADFGLAKLAESTLRTRTGVIAGTPMYMAPEQITGAGIGPACDRYAFAAMAYQLLCGRTPFEGRDLVQLMYAHVHEQPPLAGLDVVTDAVLARGLAKEAEARWPSCRALVAALAESVEGLDTTQRTVLMQMPPSVTTPSTPAWDPAAVTRILGPVPPPAVTGTARSSLISPGAGAGAAAVGTLLRMGMTRLTTDERYSLNSHFANIVHVARQVAGERWAALAEPAGLTAYLTEDPPDNAERTTPVESLSRLCDGFDAVFGPDAPEQMRRWGRLATDRSLKLRKGSSRDQRAFRMIPGAQRKLTMLLKRFAKSMDEVRGAHTHTWKQIDDNQFWLVHFANLYALGRHTTERSCYVWTSSFEAMLRWAGLANRWLVEEIECGAVTGTFDCVFAIRCIEAD